LRRGLCLSGWECGRELGTEGDRERDEIGNWNIEY
jgi:hypothetical protein